MGRFEVFELEVEEDESYETCGVFSHNCKSPNLQQIPSRTKDGREVRKGFVASSGKLLVSCDFSQLHLRLVAHLAQEPAMIEVFKAGGDIHTETARRAFGLGADDKPDKLTQRDPSKCFHPDTEVLTKQGWRRIVDLTPEQEVVQATPGVHGVVALEWAKPLEVFTAHHPSKKLIHLYNEGIDIRVTPDHRMLYWNRKHQEQVAGPKQMAEEAHYWVGAGVLGGGEPFDEDWLRLAVAVQADGHLARDGGVAFTFTRKRKAVRLTELLNRVDVSYSQSNGRMNGKPSYSFYIRKKSADHLKVYLESDKTIPSWWIELSLSNRVAILDEARYWDSWISRRSYVYTSVCQKNVDMLQAIAAISGHKSRVTYESTDSQWRNSVKDRAFVCGHNVEATELDYTDEVACISVPSSFVLVRDRGVTLVCGQTTNFFILNRGGWQGLFDVLVVNFSLAGMSRPSWLTGMWCDQFIAKWFAMYPRIEEWFRLQDYRMGRYGIAWDMFGRVRRVPEMRSVHERVRDAGLRQGGNHPLIGGEAGIYKIAQARIEGRLEILRAQEIGVEAVIPVHDELVLEVDEEWADYVAQVVCWEMEQALVDDQGELQCRVPITADSKIGPRWAKE